MIYRKVRGGATVGAVFLVMFIALLLAGCQRPVENSYRDISALGVGPGGGLDFQREGGEEEIPPLTWCDGTVTAIESDPASFDPVVDQTVSLHVTLSQSASTLRVRVLNSLDVAVKTLYSQSAPSGENQFEWDGTDDGDETVRYSIYVFDVVAYDQSHQEIGSGQTEVITYRPKAGVSLQDADKYRNENSEYMHSSDEWVAAGLVNPGDAVSVFFDNQAWGLEDSETNGIFRSEPFDYSAGQHTVKIRVFPRMTQTYYDLDYTVYLNRIHCTGLTVLLDEEPVEHEFTYFVPSDGEVVQVDYALDADELGAGMYVVLVPEDDDPVPMRTVDLGSQTAGQHSVTWDGKNDGGLLCPPGKYCITVVTELDPAASLLRPAGIFITRYIDLEEGS